MKYKVIIDSFERENIFQRMNNECLTMLAMSSCDEPSLEYWLEITSSERCIFLGCYNDDDILMGCATFTRFRGNSYEFDFTAFRDFFYCAVEQARNGFEWVFIHSDCESIVGLCPVSNRHALALANDCGFVELGRIAGACYFAPKKKFVDGVLLYVTPDNLKL